MHGDKTLWQEGHTAHATEEEAMEETLKMHEVYRELMENVLAIPIVAGEKSPNKNGDLEYAYTTSWGLSTRVIGAMIMTHSDDDGLRLPPRIF